MKRTRQSNFGYGIRRKMDGNVDKGYKDSPGKRIEHVPDAVSSLEFSKTSNNDPHGRALGAAI